MAVLWDIDHHGYTHFSMREFPKRFEQRKPTLNMENYTHKLAFHDKWKWKSELCTSIHLCFYLTVNAMWIRNFLCLPLWLHCKDTMSHKTVTNINKYLLSLIASVRCFGKIASIIAILLTLELWYLISFIYPYMFVSSASEVSLFLIFVHI